MCHNNNINNKINSNNNNVSGYIIDQRLMGSLNCFEEKVEVKNKVKKEGEEIETLTFEDNDNNVNRNSHSNSNDSKVEHIIEKLRDELKQTKELVADLESRLELTEHTSHLIVNELRTLISESDNNTTTSTSTNDTNTSNATTLFTNTASTVTAVEEDNDGQEENVEDLQDKFYDQFHDHLQIPLSTSSTSSPSPSPSPLKSSPSITSDSDDTTNDSFNRICNVLQNLIDEAQVALHEQQKNSNIKIIVNQTNNNNDNICNNNNNNNNNNSNNINNNNNNINNNNSINNNSNSNKFGISSSPSNCRPRASSWSSSWSSSWNSSVVVGNWLMNQYNHSNYNNNYNYYPNDNNYSSLYCECNNNENSEKCWFCLETNSTIESLNSITPKSSRCNSISQKYNSNTNYNNNNSNSNSNNLMVPSSSIYKDQQQQKNLIKIQKKYKKILEKKSNYNKSCDNVELELQKLINTALSTTTTNNTIHNQHMIIDNKDEEGECEGECGDKDGRFFKNKSLKWKKRILDYLKSLNNNYNNMNTGEGEGEDNEFKDDVAKSPTTSSKSSPSSSSTSFLNIFNVNNLIYNYYHDTNKIIITDSNSNSNTDLNSNSKSSNNFSSENVPNQSSSLSQNINNPLIKNLMNLSAMVGIFVLGMKRTIDNQIAHNKSMLYKKSHLLRNAIIIITSSSGSSGSRGRSMSRRIIIRRKYNYYLSIKLAKYFTILLVGWLFGRIGSGKKLQQNTNNDDARENNENNNNNIIDSDVDVGDAGLKI